MVFCSQLVKIKTVIVLKHAKTVSSMLQSKLASKQTQLTNSNSLKAEQLRTLSTEMGSNSTRPSLAGATLNNASDYRTNGQYRTSNPNPSPLAR